MTWTIRILNWRKFQHDVRRTTVWVKLYRDLLDRREWRELEPGPSKLLIDVWLLAAQFKEGEITLALADIAWRFRLGLARMVADLQVLQSLSFIEIASEALAACAPVASPEERRVEERREKEELPTGSASPNWVAPFCDAWQERFKGSAPGGRIGRALKPLRAKYSDVDILPRWARYLAATEAQFASPEKFAQTFGDWDGSAPLRIKGAADKADFLPGETIDDYIVRQARG